MKIRRSARLIMSYRRLYMVTNEFERQIPEESYRTEMARPKFEWMTKEVQRRVVAEPSSR